MFFTRQLIVNVLAKVLVYLLSIIVILIVGLIQAKDEQSRLFHVKRTLVGELCSYGVNHACDWLAGEATTFIGQDHLPEYLDKCETQSVFCEKTGYVYLDMKNSSRALHFFELACDQQRGHSCAQAGFIAYQAGNSSQSRKFYQAGCALDDPYACTDLGDSEWHSNRKDSAYNLYKKGCELGSARACGILGDYAGEDNDQERQKWYKISCEMGSQEGCRRFRSLQRNPDESANQL